MAKKLLIFLFLALIVGAGYGVVSLHSFLRNTPDLAAKSFMTELAKGEANNTYKLFSTSLKKERSQQDWQNYVKSLGQSDQAPTFVRKTQIVDRFNVYSADSNPQRFMYVLHVKNRDYQAIAVILKQDGSWKVDNFQGSYK